MMEERKNEFILKSNDLHYSTIYQLVRDRFLVKNEKIVSLINYFLAVIEGLETEESDEKFRKQLHFNLMESDQILEKRKIFFDKLDEIPKQSFSWELNIPYEDMKSKDHRYLLNRLINQITTLVEKYFDFLTLEDFDQVNKPEDWNQVFLSYAHADKLYTYGLFLLFYSQKIFLYVDWMHNGIIDSTKDLKSTLNQAMQDSVQMLFLRSINSELGIRGSGGIRQWCSWEIGNYYCKRPDQKFYTVIYGLEMETDNQVLKTFSPFKRFLNNKMSI
ncbi:MAG: hypothetical protein A2Y16_00065 [Tenericutes bacterium GWF2_57_13]|nr:MAG: hypothetical protein A2Y16_00065 [Tenericutes bacterium GWF2_57_13]